MYLLENAETIKDLYENRIAVKYGLPKLNMCAQFEKKVDDLLYYLSALNNSKEDLTVAQKKDILLMNGEILKDMKQLLGKNEVSSFKTYSETMMKDLIRMKNCRTEELKQELIGQANYLPKSKNTIPFTGHKDNDKEMTEKLEALDNAMQASNRAIYGKRSPQFKAMQIALMQTRMAAAQLSGSLINNLDAEAIQRKKKNYASQLAVLKTAAEKYYLYKMNATTGGAKANKRERARLDLAKLAMDIANGKDPAVVCKNIPAELNVPAPVKNAPVKKQSVALFA